MAAPLTPEQVDALLTAAGPGSAVHLVGAGGCGMSGLGHLLLDLGHCVTGSDLVLGEEVRQLQARGADIGGGHAAERVQAGRPVLVVFTSAVRSDNAELQAARQLHIPVVRRATLLAALLRRQHGICVAGMHGKTTTSSLLSFALENLGAQPSFAVGALVPQLPRHARFSPPSPVAPRPYFVIETDESDGTLRQFHPQDVILLNVDAEHLDYYEGLESICREFALFAAQARGLKIYCKDDAHLSHALDGQPGAVSFGFHALADYRVEKLAPRPSPLATSFTVWHRGEKLDEFTTLLIGEKNLSNAAAVVALLHQLGYAPADVARAIAPFCGAARRQQLLHADERVRIYDDYGHHPNEIRATLRAFKQLGAGRLVVVFQPHRFTRTRLLLQEFATCFADADELWLTEIYPASEPPIPGVTSAVMAQAIRAQGQPVHYVPDLKDLGAAVMKTAQPGDLILFLGAGDTTKVAHQVAAQVRIPPSGGRTGMQTQRDESLSAGPPEAGTLAEKIHAELASLLSPETVLRSDEPMAKRTMLRVGGLADFYVEPASEAELASVLRYCRRRQLPFLMLGRGSNLLVRDGGIRGMVICLAHDCFSQVRVIGQNIHCGAGAKLKAVVTEAKQHGLSGLEFLEGIPGSVGGAMRMNAGAMGSWLFDVVETIRFMDFDGNVTERKASEVNVEYRGCPLFKTHLALGAVLCGQPADRKAIEEQMDKFSQKRWESQPAQPSAGCIFKNPKEIPAGKLIDELGLRGKSIGGAMVSDVHGNFIVNTGGATASDVLRLIEFIQQLARSKRKIELETEVEIIGE